MSDQTQVEFVVFCSFAHFAVSVLQTTVELFSMPPGHPFTCWQVFHLDAGNGSAIPLCSPVEFGAQVEGLSVTLVQRNVHLELYRLTVPAFVTPQLFLLSRDHTAAPFKLRLQSEDRVTKAVFELKVRWLASPAPD